MLYDIALSAFKTIYSITFPKKLFNLVYFYFFYFFFFFSIFF